MGLLCVCVALMDACVVVRFFFANFFVNFFFENWAQLTFDWG